MKTATIRNNVTVKESNQERIAFAQTIDFQPLFDHTCSFSKVNCEFSTPIIEVNRAGDVYISFKSEDIASQTGPFAAILKECRFENFGCRVSENEETGVFRFHGSVTIQYEHINGGFNGMDVIYAVYSENDGWAFDDAGA